MEKTIFHKMKKAAAAEVAAFLKDGYIVVVCAETIATLRHCRNGARITIKADMRAGTITVQKNSKIIKTICYG